MSVNSLVEEKILGTAYKNLENSALHFSSVVQAQFDMAWYYKNDSIISDSAKQMEASSERERSEIQKELISRLVKKNNIERYSFPFYFMVLDYEGNMMTNFAYTPYAGYSEVYQEIAKTDWFGRLERSYTDQAFMFSAPDYLNAYGSERFYVASNITQEDNVGVLVIAVDKRTMKAQLNSSFSQGSLFIVSENGDLIMEESDGTLQYNKEIYDQFLEYKNNPKSPEIVTIKLTDSEDRTGREYALMSKEVVIKGYMGRWNMISVVPMKNITSDLDRIKLTNAVVLLLYAAAAVWVLAMLNRSIVAPILSLCSLVKEVTKGNLEVRAEQMPNNELRQLGDGFNGMVHNLNLYFHDLKEQEELKRKTEVRLLQNQIKPHFVRNVLNTIRWLAEINGVTGVSKSVLALSALLEYNFKDVELLSTVGEEVAYVKQYLYLQKLRFQNQFKDIYDIEESLYELPMLKLTLQPIVENSIYHGLLNRQGLGTIYILAKRRKNMIEFVIRDDGVGMSKEKAEKILEPPKDGDILENIEHTENIALWNISQRIVRQYGEDYGLTVSSEEGKGTVVVIHFPVLEGKSND